MDYVRPIIKSHCGHCLKESEYFYEAISNFGEAICPRCKELFWSTKLLKFVKEVDSI